MRTYGAYLLDEDPDDGVPFGTLAVDASWLDATGADGGVGCLAGSLTSARLWRPPAEPLGLEAWWIPPGLWPRMW